MIIEGSTVRRWQEETSGTYRDMRGRYSKSPAILARQSKAKAEQKRFIYMWGFALMGWFLFAIAHVGLMACLTIIN